MCLNAPDITTELRYVVLRLFKQIQDSARKRFFDGFYIEPGTVVRCDGTTSRTTSGDDLSATFICLPYLALKARQEYPRQEFSEYPTRSMLQSLYPYESTANREAPPRFYKDVPHAKNNVMYVPQLWVVVIGSSKLIGIQVPNSFVLNELQSTL
jgi:hypothetical protein